MASTITPSTLTVSISDSISLNGRQQGSVTTKRISDIKEIYKRIVRCIDDSDCTIAAFQTATHTVDNAIDLENVRYIRVTNLDDTNPMNLSLQVSVDEDGAADASSTHLIGAGESFILHTIHDGVVVDDDADGIVTALTDLESLLVDPLSENIDVEKSS